MRESFAEYVGKVAVTPQPFELIEQRHEILTQSSVGGFVPKSFQTPPQRSR